MCRYHWRYTLCVWRRRQRSGRRTNIENKWNHSISPDHPNTHHDSQDRWSEDESAVLCQPKNYANIGSRKPVKPIRNQRLSLSKCAPEVWKCKRLTEGFLEGFTRIRHGAGEKWRWEHKKKCILLHVLRGDYLKWAATTTVLDNSGALAGRQQSFCTDAKQKLAKASGHTTTPDVFSSYFW